MKTETEFAQSQMVIKLSFRRCGGERLKMEVKHQPTRLDKHMEQMFSVRKKTLVNQISLTCSRANVDQLLNHLGYLQVCL